MLFHMLTALTRVTCIGVAFAPGFPHELVPACTMRCRSPHPVSAMRVGLGYCNSERPDTVVEKGQTQLSVCWARLLNEVCVCGSVVGALFKEVVGGEV